MRKIVLISCVSKKLSHKAKAEDLYKSPLFKYSLEYAKSLRPDVIFILSAEYGLLPLDKEIEPYNKTLNKMSEKEIRIWANNVISQLEERADLQKDEIIFFAGQKYRKYLIPHIKNYKIPLEKLSIGGQLNYLKTKLKNALIK
jgi:hypothetical protein